MKSNNQVFTLRWLIWTIGIALGIFLRLFYLGVFPLDNIEATLALQAHQVAQGLPPSQFGGNPLYLLLTTATFYLFGTSDFLARIIPALAGIAFLFFPFSIRKYLTPGWMLTMTWFFAVEPSLLAASRISSGDMLAMTFILFTISAWLAGKYKTTAILAGLTLLGGPITWFGLVIILVSCGAYRLITGTFPCEVQEESFLRKPFFWGLVLAAFLTVGSMLLTIPNGLSAFGNSFVDLIQLASKPGNTSLKLTLLAIPFYTPMVFFSGMVALIRSFVKRDTWLLLFSIAAIVAFLAVVLFPGRQLTLLIWVTVPLLFLSSKLITNNLTRLQGYDFYTWIIAGFVLLILVFLWQVFGTLNQGNLEMSDFMLYFGASIVILLVCAILAILGWSIQTTGMGYGLGFLIVATMLMLMSAFRTVGNLDNPRMEFWNDGVEPAQVNLLGQTVREISGRVKGVPNGLDIISLGKIQPAIAWNLRDQNIIRVEGLASVEDPAIIITTEDIQLEMEKAYRGQDFSVQAGVDWDSFTVQDWMRWYMIRKAKPSLFFQNILWVRADLFPGYRSTILPME